MKRIRIVIEVEIPETTLRREFNEEVLRIAQSNFGSLKYVATEPVSNLDRVNLFTSV